MSIIIHIKTSSVNNEKDEDVGEESIVERSSIKNIDSNVNKPITTRKNSNNLNRIDKSEKSFQVQKKSNSTTEEKNLDLRDIIKAMKKSESDSYSIQAKVADVSEIDNISYVINKGKRINYKEINKIMNNENFVYEHYIKGQKENENNVQHKSLMNNGFIENNTQPNTNEISNCNLKNGNDDKTIKRNEKINELNKKVERIKTKNEKVYETAISSKAKEKESESCFPCVK